MRSIEIRKVELYLIIIPIMQLYELIHHLQRIEETFGGFIPVHIRIDYCDEIELFGIIPVKQDDGEYILILE